MLSSFVLAAAHAANFSAEIAVPSAFTVDPYPGQIVRFERIIHTKLDLPNTTVQSTDPRVSCIVKNKELKIRFEADQASYPPRRSRRTASTASTRSKWMWCGSIRPSTGPCAV